MQTNTFMYPSINTKVWSELCYCCADAVFILEYIASTSHCEIFSLSSWNQDLWMHQSAVGVCYYVWPCHFLAKVLRCSQWCTHSSLSHSHIRYTKVQFLRVCHYVWPCHFLAKVLRCSQWCTHRGDFKIKKTYLVKFKYLIIIIII